MEVTDFDYDLPQELIAQTPVEPRDSSRLLVMDKKTGELEHRHFFNLPEYLKPGDLLVFNDTRVSPARLHGFKTTGAHVEVFLLTRKNATDWEVLVKPGKKLQKGARIKFSDELNCEILDTTDFGGRIARFQYDGIFEEILDRLGETPLPPYIHEKLEDKERYQTVYNRERGSAAAPTAGLHFTRELLQKIRDMGVEEVFVTLHVGLGTFRPVNESRIEDHKMHREFYTVSQEAADAINKAKREGRRIIAVGTTSVRTLESAGASGEMKAGGNWTSIFIYP
ncbi:tRNA preQ1(34) S-adenosylmethionine ribosyltransferase-isomerase QueA, partial [Acidaminococcus fermentans]|uniref:tRNA preQ1(34) S-adenosylmethionine ribosyltransferase-isomerase QueA n=1 Tax=Acidaminococcus fermentans TaxID=905 RepID=UPI002E777561